MKQRDFQKEKQMLMAIEMVRRMEKHWDSETERQMVKLTDFQKEKLKEIRKLMEKPKDWRLVKLRD